MTGIDNAFQIGAQVLPNNMLECCFHYKNAIQEQIADIRRRAAKSSVEFSRLLRTNPQEAVVMAGKYNNTISILGSRGAGKTSIIMSFRDMYNQENRQDGVRSGKNIMMPMLIPQDFAPGQPLLSWVITQLVKKSEEIEEKLQRDGGIAARYIWSEWQSEAGLVQGKDPLRACTEDLLAAFNLRYQSRGNVQQIQDLDGEDIYYYVDSLKHDTHLAQNILKLISMFVDYYRYELDHSAERRSDTSSGESGAEREPLLFFTIDDLDLAPERSSEVLELVLRYLQHPNVVVLCGWYHELFQNNLCIDLLRNQGVLNSNQINENYGFYDAFMERSRRKVSALDSARRLASDNLKKAFPPTQRYEIRSLTTTERACFPYALIERLPEEERQEAVNKRLFTIIEQSIEACAHRTASINEKQHTFLFEGSRELTVYMRIFDGKARGLSNAYKAFASLLERQRTLEEKRKSTVDEKDRSIDITDDIKNLFDAILFSNTRFLPYRRGLRDLVQIKKVVVGDAPVLDYYCNFKSVKPTLEQYQEEKERVQDARYADPMIDEHMLEQKYDYFPAVIIDVYILLNFMENFLRTITQYRLTSHGGKEFSAALNELHPQIDFETDDQTRLVQAIQVSGLQKFSFFPDTANFALNVSILDAYEKAGFEQKQYHFTGFDCLKGIFEMAEGVLAPNGALNFETASNALRADPDWVLSITRLLIAVRPNEENIRRLSLYSSLTDVLRDDNLEIQSAVQQCLGDGRSALKNAERAYKKTTASISDNDLNALVWCARTIDSNRKRFFDLINRNNGNNTITLGNRGTSSRTTYFRAMAYLNVGQLYEGSLEKISPMRIIIASPEEYRERLSRYLAVREPEAMMSENDTFELSIIQMALERADKDIESILHDLRARLLIAFYQNLSSAVEGTDKDSVNGLICKQRYLRHAAFCIGAYMERWELLPGGWGMEEMHASVELSSIFRYHGLGDLVESVEKIMRQGLDLHRRGRVEYTDMVNRLRLDVNEFVERFEKREWTSIQRWLDILASAPKKTRRDLEVEVKLYDVLLDLGKEVSWIYSNVMLQLFSSADGDAETQLAVWPVGKDNLPFFDELARKFEPLMPRKLYPGKATLFDAEYSDVELLVQASIG